MNDKYIFEKKIANILIVDDTPANLKILGIILKNEGFKIRPVLNGELALQVAEKEKPDLILLDIMMPGLNGFEVCQRLKKNEKLKDVPVIFISALSEPEDKVRAFREGGVDYISKPFQVDEVIARINIHLKIVEQTKKLIELNATKNKFFSIIAHDLRGPISNLMMISEAIEETNDMDDETLKMFLDIQKTSSKETMDLLENLLIWAKSNTNLIQNSPEKIDINGIIKTNIDSFRNELFIKEINVNINIDDFIPLEADPNMVCLVLRNLISNAVKFTPKSGIISISAHAGKEYSVLVKIEDNGLGMSENQLNNLFRLDVNNKRYGTEGETSNGLGLVLCHEFIEKMGGKIWAESEENKGSTFSFSLP